MEEAHGVRRSGECRKYACDCRSKTASTTVSNVYFALPAWLALAGCASSAALHDTVAVHGRILETFLASASLSQGVHNAGLFQGSAFGNLVISAAGEPPHTIYVLVLPDGTKRFACSRDMFPIGACVSVKTERARTTQESWT